MLKKLSEIYQPWRFSVKPEKKEPIKCHVCGDKGTVLRAYVEPTASLPRAKDKVECPRCLGGRK